MLRYLHRTGIHVDGTDSGLAQVYQANGIALDKDDATVEVVQVPFAREIRYVRNATCNGAT